MTDWQPIETAPKDGTIILVPGMSLPIPVRWEPESYRKVAIDQSWLEFLTWQGVGFKRVKDGGGWTAVCEIGRHGNIGRWANRWGLSPTHWMPLPPPPVHP